MSSPLPPAAPPPDRVRRLFDRLLFGSGASRRYTLDAPVRPDVWHGYAVAPTDQLDLLLAPARDVRPGELFTAVHAAVGRDADVSYNTSVVAARLTFEEFVRVVIPLTSWHDALRDDTTESLLSVLSDPRHDDSWLRQRARRRLEDDAPNADGATDPPEHVQWLIRLLLAVLALHEGDTANLENEDEFIASLPAFSERLASIARDSLDAHKRMIWSVTRNRPATAADARSSQAIKADAARRVFHLSCRSLTWAVLDSGVDARHPALQARGGNGDLPPLDQWPTASRVVATYDFTLIRDLTGPVAERAAREPLLQLRLENDRGALEDLRANLISGRTVDWALFEPFLRVPHDAGYAAPANGHGTHVAGVLAGDWRSGDPGNPSMEDILGVCPDLQLYDIRVLDADGEGDEFTVMAALQFIRHLNSRADAPVVHGANLSLSIPHDVSNYACGRTPVCEEAERLVANGVVVVAAAGNGGYGDPAGDHEGYRSISITDPGNAERVITVGSTHRYRPHTYGVSYFSSRGPTGDGRAKPDLVAPGEKIYGPAPDGAVRTLDGTSLAAPHVSGAAALLMARHRELVGQPDRVKQILCDTATDLGRERYFQGAGMVDALRALQAV